MSSVLSVTQLNTYIKSLFDDDKRLKNIFMCGEISNFTDHYRSGHLYFSLKDDKSVIKAVMFAKSATTLKFRPQDGMKVIVSGQISVYEATGQYQFYVRSMQPDGIGALNLAYEQLKDKLKKEGLFDSETKRALPKYPQNIAVITSPTGAAVRDIFQIITRRWPLCEVDFYPSAVQGVSAVPELLRALESVSERSRSDIIIIGRGGGSIEDLWAFNDETLARAVYDSPIPVISAVGHETDFTICDFVADMRAPTPSAAAELATPDINEEADMLAALISRLCSSEESILSVSAQKLDRLVSSAVMSDPAEFIRKKQDELKYKNTELSLCFNTIVSEAKEELGRLSGSLDSLSPLKILSRGFSYLEKVDKAVIRSIEQIETHDKISVRLSDGSFTAEVIEKTNF